MPTSRPLRPTDPSTMIIARRQARRADETLWKSSGQMRINNSGSTPAELEVAVFTTAYPLLQVPPRRPAAIVAGLEMAVCIIA
mmetsp:Transcript_30733/g.99413  ORF Transcript_30733/g.99413 Transcript_30733/m.99413 type:complete len:83 (-) Transcript_30733:34-282(-)